MMGNVVYRKLKCTQCGSEDVSRAKVLRCRHCGSRIVRVVAEFDTEKSFLDLRDGADVVRFEEKPSLENKFNEEQISANEPKSALDYMVDEAAQINTEEPTSESEPEEEVLLGSEPENEQECAVDKVSEFGEEKQSSISDPDEESKTEPEEREEEKEERDEIDELLWDKGFPDEGSKEKHREKDEFDEFMGF
ncbi:MAG: hypothetical protein KAR20_23155 [Candidatus Heimdallarchaeota archaeon]|nr:hypothetical protein [Candidatus Heimdallarchaeota archaeon]